MKKILLWTVAITAIIAAVTYFSGSEHQKPALDYSKRVYTNGFAIVCPLGLLLDPQSGHGPEAVADLFTSISNLSSKEQELGCTEWRGGLRVDAVRMSPPFEDYVQINGTLFTMESHLTNAPQ